MLSTYKKRCIINVLTGVAVGAGWQSIVAYVNIASYYLVGIPIGAVLGYIIDLQVKVSFSFSLIIFQATFFVSWKV